MLRWVSSFAILLLSLVAGKQAVERPRITLVAPGFPCSFGPYQKQLLILAREFQKKGHAVEWLAVHEELDAGRHELRDLGEQTIVACTQMYGTGLLDVLHEMTYLGYMKETIFPGGPIGVSHMNRVAKKYNIKKMLMLMDVDTWIKNTDQFDPITIFWLPYHYEVLLSKDRYFLESVHAVAALTPSMAKEMRQTMADDVHVAAIPHVIEDKFFGMSRSQVRKELGIPENKFVVLMQGGNYEPTDRKGWFIGLQAYVRFRTLHPEADTFLYIHAPSSVTIAAMDHAESPPPHLEKRGVPLHTYFELLGIKKGEYAFTDQIYSSEWVAKKNYWRTFVYIPQKRKVLACMFWSVN